MPKSFLLSFLVPCHYKTSYGNVQRWSLRPLYESSKGGLNIGITWYWCSQGFIHLECHITINTIACQHLIVVVGNLFFLLVTYWELICLLFLLPLSEKAGFGKRKKLYSILSLFSWENFLKGENSLQGAYF